MRAVDASGRLGRSAAPPRSPALRLPRGRSVIDIPACVPCRPRSSSPRFPIFSAPTSAHSPIQNVPNPAPGSRITTLLLSRRTSTPGKIIKPRAADSTARAVLRLSKRRKTKKPLGETSHRAARLQRQRAVLALFRLHLPFPSSQCSRALARSIRRCGSSHFHS
jgi:hypothetical protein